MGESWRVKPGIALSALFAWTAGSAATAVLVCGCSAGTVLSRDRMDDLRAQGVAPDMVYLVQLPGYELAEQSMSVYDAEGFQTYYVSPQGGQVWLGVERGEFGDSTCEKRPVHDAEPAGGTVRCAYDEVGWYRMSGRWMNTPSRRAGTSSGWAGSGSMWAVRRSRRPWPGCGS